VKGKNILRYFPGKVIAELVDNWRFWRDKQPRSPIWARPLYAGQFICYNAAGFGEEVCMDKYPMTLEGKKKLEVELKELRTVKRPANVKAIEEARAHGDLSENAEYHAAKEQQSLIAGRIEYLEDRISRAEIIDVSKLSGHKVLFGAKVTMENVDTGEETTYRIVGDDEADIDRGSVSISSPIARALIGREVGDEVTIRTPGGSRVVEIVEVEF
jgi:transcription elongation factor GreA